MTPSSEEHRATAGVFGSAGEQLHAIVAVWASSPGFHELHPPLDEDGRRSVETRLGRPLPAALRELYEATNGAYLFDGCLQIEPASRAIALADELRGYDWQIPPELLMFANNGGEAIAASMDALGMPDDLRLHSGDNSRAPFVEWSDPGLPHHEPESYVQRLDPSAVGALIAQMRP
jgi:hypothetical protein